MLREVGGGGGGKFSNFPTAGSTNVTIAALYVPSTGLDGPSVSFNRFGFGTGLPCFIFNLTVYLILFPRAFSAFIMRF